MRTLPHRATHLLALTLPALWLTACGGGGGGGTSSVSLTKDDSLTYQLVSTPTGGSASTSYATQTFTSVAGTRVTQVDTNSAGEATVVRNFTAKDTQTTSTQGSVVRTSGAGTRSTLQTFPAGSPAQGDAWNYNIIETCMAGSQSAGSNIITGSGKILGTETLDTLAGSFSTLKYQISEIISDTAGNTELRQSICWRDTSLNVVVRCDDKITSTVSDGGSTTSTRVVRTLVGVSVANLSSSSPTLERFAGAWNLNYSGTDSGSCIVQIAADGALNAPACYSDASGYYTLSGTVSLTGDFSANASTGQVFAGKLNSPLAGNGTWLNGSYSQGTWSASHR